MQSEAFVMLSHVATLVSFFGLATSRCRNLSLTYLDSTVWIKQTRISPVSKKQVAWRSRLGRWQLLSHIGDKQVLALFFTNLFELPLLTLLSDPSLGVFVSSESSVSSAEQWEQCRIYFSSNATFKMLLAPKALLDYR